MDLSTVCLENHYFTIFESRFPQSVLQRIFQLIPRIIFSVKSYSIYHLHPKSLDYFVSSQSRGFRNNIAKNFGRKYNILKRVIFHSNFYFSFAYAEILPKHNSILNGLDWIFELAVLESKERKNSHILCEFRKLFMFRNCLIWFEVFAILILSW